MIRLATKQDIPRLLEIIEAYSYENPLKILSKKENHFPNYVEQLLFSIIKGRGFILVDENLCGALIAVKQTNIWCPKINELHELLWWVEPEHRNGTIGGRLWKRYDQLATEMLKRGDVDVVFSTLSASSPLVNYEKRGYKAIDKNFVKEI